MLLLTYVLMIPIMLSLCGQAQRFSFLHIESC